MKNKKVVFIAIVILLCIAILILMIMKFMQKNDMMEISEITPGEEMTEEQERQTIISLYYTNVETESLMPEARVIDVKNLLENPYKTLVEYLLEMPKNEKLKSSLPDGTKVNNATLTEDMVILDLSNEFIQNQYGNSDDINLSINAIVNTLTELNEVNSVKILIDGEENKSFEGTDIVLNGAFTRKA